jgi:chemotaxis protein methyltransferase CheR
MVMAGPKVQGADAGGGKASLFGKEYEFTDQHFDHLRQMIERSVGIKLSDVKRELIYGRLARRIRKLKLSGFDEYLEILDSDVDERDTHFINAITTNLTSFFREPHHFEFLTQTALPDLLARNARSRRIRIWSAGCSTGEEPYSIAMAVRETLGSLAGWDVKILATDIDSNVLDKGRNGVYEADRIAGLDGARANKWFMKGGGGNVGMVRVANELRDLITFNRLNLMEAWPISGKVDVIFCRNVVIYFDKETQKVLFNRFADALDDGRFLFIGHSENLFRITDRFELLGRTVYRKTA